MNELENLKIMLSGMDPDDPNYSILDGIIQNYETNTSGLGDRPTADFDMTDAGRLTREELAARDARAAQAQDVMNLGTLGLDLYKMGKGAIQSRRADERLQELMGQRPQYIPQRQDPRLQQAIRDATVDAAQGYSPSTLAGLYGEIMDTNRAADLAARTAGGGQASTYGALAQANALNRYDALRGVTADEEQMKLRKRAGLNNLIAQGIQEKNMIQRGLDRNFFNNTLPFYNQQLMGAEAEGRAGRMNIANTLERMPADVANAVSYYGIPDVNIQAPSFQGIRDRFTQTPDMGGQEFYGDFVDPYEGTGMDTMITKGGPYVSRPRVSSGPMAPMQQNRSYPQDDLNLSDNLNYLWITKPGR